MSFNENVQLELPDSFPGDAYDSFMTAARAVLLRVKGAAWGEFAGASNLIAWRYRNCYEQLEDYAESWEKHGGNVNFEEIYIRERNLFGTFASGVSCIEATCYACYALASHEDVLGLTFGPAQQRFCSPTSLRNALRSESKASEIVTALSALLDSDQWATWVDFRNRMTHRSNLPRHIRATLGVNARPPEMKPLEFAGTSSTPPTDGDLESFRGLLTFLSNSLKCILDGARQLAIS